MIRRPSVLSPPTIHAGGERAAGRTVGRPPRKATTVQLVFMTYAVVCGGAYGLEQIVSSSGPGLAVVILLALPFVYAAPLALTCAELSARFPIEGGYYRWVRMAFGDCVGYTAGWLMWLTMFSTTASFAVLFGNYLRYFVPGLSTVEHVTAAAALVWVAVLLNIRGIRLVGTASVTLTILIFIPFVVMTVMGVMAWRYNPMTPFANPDQPLSTALFSGLLIAMWLYGGFEKLTVNAEEIENPVRAFPTAIAIAVPLCAMSYILPTLAALAANGRWREWGESHYVVAASQIGGPWLGAAMAAGALVSNLGLVLVTILGQSRLPLVLAEDGLFPRAFQTCHARFGTPVVSLIVSGVVLTALCGFGFEQLVGTAALVQSLAYLLIYAALFTLRRRDAASNRPGFRVPLGSLGLALVVAPSAMIVVFVIGHALFADGSLDRRQALLNLAIIGSGPITYALARRRAKASPALSALGAARGERESVPS